MNDERDLDKIVGQVLAVNILLDYADDTLLDQYIHILKHIETCPNFIKEKIISEEIHTFRSKNNKFELYVLCNDLFWWACADAEYISESDYDDIKKALDDSDKDNGLLLWVARKRKMRPQKAYYKYFSEKEAELFDECGSEHNE